MSEDIRETGFRLAREPVNVADFHEGQRIVENVRNLRAEARLEISTIRHWNDNHPDEEPVGEDLIAYYEALILWCDRAGPFPELPDPEPTWMEDR